MIGHRDGIAMAKCLVTYIDDDRRVRSEIMAEFMDAPCLHRIAEIRKSHARALSAAQTEPFKPHDGYNPSEASDKADRANVLFVHALWREQEASARLAAFRARRDRALSNLGEVA